MNHNQEHKVEFLANPIQKRFIESRAEADLFSSRKGEGKSAALCWACFYHTQFNPGAHWLFIRDTWENLQRTTLEEFFHWFPDGIYGKWNAGAKCYVWNTARTGLSGKVFWLGLDDDADASKVASMPLAGFAIDEPSPAAAANGAVGSSGVSELIFDTAWAQLRQPGMNWYAAKLAQNNPDESHWTYRRFVDPGTKAMKNVKILADQTGGFKAWQTQTPENVRNLKPGYYEGLKRTWKHRPDLIKRFVTGEYGYQQVGRAVTPQWRDELHLTEGIEPVRGVPLHMLWDGGLNPTCIITQVTPQGFWLILQSWSLSGIGIYELIRRRVAPTLNTRYRGFTWKHIGDPNLRMREQSSSNQSAARVIVGELGGRFMPGPSDIRARVEPLGEVLTRTVNGVGMVQVDKKRAKEVWYALRGGWHWRIARSGQEGGIVKDQHSHPGDCMGYGAAKLFPLGGLRQKKKSPTIRTGGGYYNRAPHPGTSIGMSRTDVLMPREGRILGGKNGRD